MKRGGLAFSEDFAAGGDRVLFFGLFYFRCFYVGLLRWRKREQKVSLPLESSGCGETCDNSSFWESLFIDLNCPSVKFCIPYRLILQVLLCYGS